MQQRALFGVALILFILKSWWMLRGLLRTNGKLMEKSEERNDPCLRSFISVQFHRLGI